jgi:glucosylceramidase
MADSAAAEYVSGVAVHWYAEVEDTLNHFQRLTETHNRHPDLFILASEACNGYLPPQGPRLGYWRWVGSVSGVAR